MSIDFVQLGQCGNQIGHAFFDFMLQETQMANPGAQALLNETFFFERKNRMVVKALLIDMEPKVVNRCLKAEYYDKAFSLTKQEGSGNNWAYGFNNHGPSNKNAILTLMDGLLEESGYVESMFFISSLAGGTELFADRFPEIEFFNVCVMPHLTGEVILQSLNTVLTIGSIYKHSEGIILLQNDEAQALCNNLLNLKNPSLADINQVMSTNLASLFWPSNIPSLEAAYYWLIIKDFNFQNFASSIITSDYLLAILFGKSYAPKAESISIGKLLKSATKFEKCQELLIIQLESDLNWVIDSKHTPDKL